MDRLLNIFRCGIECPVWAHMAICSHIQGVTSKCNVFSWNEMKISNFLALPVVRAPTKADYMSCKPSLIMLTSSETEQGIAWHEKYERNISVRSNLLIDHKLDVGDQEYREPPRCGPKSISAGTNALLSVLRRKSEICELFPLGQAIFTPVHHESWRALFDSNELISE